MIDYDRRWTQPFPRCGSRCGSRKDDKDPELVTRLAQALAPTTTTVGKATDAGGHLLATVVFAGPGGRRPAVVPFVPRDGSWRLDRHWACENIAGIGSPSPACE